MNDLERSDLDKKSYRVIHLENGVRAILISDLKPGEVAAKEAEEEAENVEAELPAEEANGDGSESDEAMDTECGDPPSPAAKKVQMSAAAICINAGSLHEDNEIQGLAHYLEHMVFMGSEKYPSENDFDSFVSQRGGSYNAWTDCEMTLFYFDVHTRFFRSSLDRFANFFVAPLLSASSMDREVTAVDSEFKMSLSQDSWRVEHFTKTLADADHPYSFFTIGNVESLKTTPQARGIDVYKNLQDRRKRMYSAQYITVAVQSKESLDDLEKLVRDIFVHVQNNGIERPLVPKKNPFRNDQFMGKLYKIVPIKDIRKLIITWVLPPYRHKYLSRPHAIFGFLLGHEAKGSILSYLRKKNLAVGLTAGCYGSGFELNECATMIRLEAMLTEEGLERVDEVIEAVFSYCAVLRKRGLPDEVFSDMRQLAANSFRFQEETEPIDFVCLLAENLQKYKEEHVISGSYVYHEHGKDLYTEALSLLVPQEANFMLLSMGFENKENKVEKWYNISYSEEVIPKEKLQKWMDIQPDESVFHLPKKNDFIAQNFKLIDHNPSYAKHPIKLDLPDNCKDHGVLWYMQDTKFSMPKTVCNFFLCTPTYTNQPRNYVVAKVMIEIINQELADVTYDAEEADLRYNLSVSTHGIDLSVEGFNDKLFKLFTTVVDALNDFKSDEARFAACKEKVRQELVNYAYQPRKLYTDIQNFALRNKATLVSDLLDLLRVVELKDVVELAKTSWNPAHLLGYVHGNLTPFEALEYFAYCKKKLDFEAWPSIERLVCAEVPTGETRCRVRNLNPCDVNTVLVDFYQLGAADLKLSIRAQLLNEILNEPCFNFLRTKETLGYAVWFRRFCIAGVEALSVHVESQADKFPLEHCHAKMLEFIEREAKVKLDGLSQKDFEIYVSSLIKSKMVEDVNMGQLVRRNWEEIANDNLLFDRLEKEVNLLSSITKDEVLDLFHTTFLKDSKRKLVFQVNADEKPPLTGGEEKIYQLDIAVEPVNEKWIKTLDDLRKGIKYHPYTRVV